MRYQFKYLDGKEIAETMKNAAEATAQVTVLLHEALQKRVAADDYIIDLLTDPDFYEQERARTLSEAG